MLLESAKHKALLLNPTWAHLTSGRGRKERRENNPDHSYKIHGKSRGQRSQLLFAFILLSSNIDCNFVTSRVSLSLHSSRRPWATEVASAAAETSGWAGENQQDRQGLQPSLQLSILVALVPGHIQEKASLCSTRLRVLIPLSTGLHEVLPARTQLQCGAGSPHGAQGGTWNQTRKAAWQIL